MRNTICLLLLSVIAVIGAFSSGCANVERKFGRGLDNSWEIVRGGEYRRSVEQTALFDAPDVGYTHGAMRGINRTFARTGIGLYEIITAPFPPYGPVATNHFSVRPAYPDNYHPDLVEDSLFATDTYVGYSGGDVAPFVPGSRFQIFETH
jgi:putative exosortase-associated protein (TIGR04073 family)